RQLADGFVQRALEIALAGNRVTEPALLLGKHLLAPSGVWWRSRRCRSDTDDCQGDKHSKHRSSYGLKPTLNMQKQAAGQPDRARRRAAPAVLPDFRHARSPSAPCCHISGTDLKATGMNGEA